MTFVDPSLRFLIQGGETGREILAKDWSASPLGPISAWPLSLRTTLATMLACPVPMFLAWGTDLVSFYNDPYREVLGNRVSRAMGIRFRDLWADLWADVGPLCDRALAGEPVSVQDMPLTMTRNGRPEPTWWTFSYSPVHDDAGAIVGMICITRETTAQVLAERDREESRARLDLALSAGDGIGTWDWDVSFGPRDGGRPLRAALRGRSGAGRGRCADRGLLQRHPSRRPPRRSGADRGGDPHRRPFRRGIPPRSAGRRALGRRARPMRPRCGRPAPAVSGGELRHQRAPQGRGGRADGRARVAPDRGRASEPDRLHRFVPDLSFRECRLRDVVRASALRGDRPQGSGSRRRRGRSWRASRPWRRRSTGSEVRFEMAWPYADGRERVADIRYIPRRDADGRGRRLLRLRPGHHRPDAHRGGADARGRDAAPASATGSGRPRPT